jgi:hypothetical protein
MKQLLKLLLVGIIVGIVLMLMQLIFMAASGNEILFNQDLLINFGYNQFFSIILTLGNGYYYNYLNNKVNWKKYKSSRIIIGAIVSFIIKFLSIFILKIVINV